MKIDKMKTAVEWLESEMLKPNLILKVKLELERGGSPK